MKRNAALIALCALVVTPALAGDVDVKLSGVDPNVYLQARSGKPNVARELKKSPIAITEHILRAKSAAELDVLLVDDNAYPAFVKAGDIPALRAAEREALLVGALLVAGEKRLPHLIMGQLENPDDDVRAEAAERYGEAGGDVGKLADIARRDPVLKVRTAAIAGLGRSRSELALDVIEPLLIEELVDETTQVAAVRALAILSSKWAWEAVGDAAQGERIRQRAALLLAKAKGTSAAQKRELASAIRDVERMLAR